MEILEKIQHMVYLCRKLMENLRTKYGSKDVLKDLKGGDILGKGNIEIDGEKGDYALYASKLEDVIIIQLRIGQLSIGCGFNPQTDKIDFNRFSLRIYLKSAGVVLDFKELQGQLLKLVEAGHIIGDPTNSKNRLYLVTENPNPS